MINKRTYNTIQQQQWKNKRTNKIDKRQWNEINDYRQRIKKLRDGRKIKNKRRGQQRGTQCAKRYNDNETMKKYDSATPNYGCVKAVVVGVTMRRRSTRDVFIVAMRFFSR